LAPSFWGVLGPFILGVFTLLVFFVGYPDKRTLQKSIGQKLRFSESVSGIEYTDNGVLYGEGNGFSAFVRMANGLIVEVE
jgi:hypothetical protein